LKKAATLAAFFFSAPVKKVYHYRPMPIFLKLQYV